MKGGKCGDIGCASHLSHVKDLNFVVLKHSKSRLNCPRIVPYYINGGSDVKKELVEQESIIFLHTYFYEKYFYKIRL